MKQEPATERPALASSPCKSKGRIMGSQLLTNTANNLITIARAAGQPVWLRSAVKDILREHPDCGLTVSELANIVRQRVIKQRWSFDGG